MERLSPGEPRKAPRLFCFLPRSLRTDRFTVSRAPVKNPAHLYRTILLVPDIERAAQFYGTLLGVPGQRVSPGRHYFDCGGVILACYDPVADGDGKQDGWQFHPLQYLYFAVADLAGMLERANAAGAVIEQPIQSMPWGERLFYCRDPFGSGLCFVDAATKFTRL